MAVTKFLAPYCLALCALTISVRWSSPSPSDWLIQHDHPVLLGWSIRAVLPSLGSEAFLTSALARHSAILDSQSTKTRTFALRLFACSLLLLGGDISINPGPSAPSSECGLNVLYLNARNVKALVPLEGHPSRKICKLAIRQQLVYGHSYDVICITETWLTDLVLS